MARWVGRLLLFGVALAAAALVALVAATRHIDPDRLAGFVSQRVRAATGREFAVTGGLRVRIFPRIAIVAGAVRVGNVAWGSRPDMLRIRRLEGSIPLLPLLRGEIQVDRLVLVEPELFLETDATGTRNWDFAKPASPAPVPPPASGLGSPLTLRLDSIALERGSATARDGKTGDEVRLSLDSLTLKRPAASTMNALDLAGSLQGRPFTVTGQVSPLEAFLVRGSPLAVDLALATGGSTATLAGKVDRGGSGPLFAGAVKIHVTGTTGRAKPAGGPVTAPLPVDLAGKLTVERHVSRLDALEIAYGRSTASGSAVLRLDTPQPELTAVLAAAWRSGETGREVRLSVDRLALRRVASSTTNSLELAGSLRGQPFTLSGRIGPLGSFIAGRNPLGADLTVATEGAAASFAGKIDRGGSSPLLAGKVKVHIAETSGVGKLAGGPVSLPVPLDLAGKLTVREGAWRMDGLEIATGIGKATGSFALHLDTPQPELTAILSATWSNRKTGKEMRLSLERLTVKRTASLANTLDLAGSLQGQPFTVTGQVGALEEFFAGHDPLALDLALATEGATVALAGKIERDRGGPFPNVTVRAHVEGTSGLAKLAGRPLTMPVPLDVAGRLTVRERTWRMDGLEIASGRSQASGSAVVRLEPPRPEVTADVNASFIDLPELAGWKRGKEKAVEGSRRRLFGDAPLPLGILQVFDGRIRLTAAGLALVGGFQLESVLLDLDLRNGRLRVDPLSFAIGAGRVAGTAEVDATPGRTPQVSARLEGGGISLERLAAEAGHTGMIVGGSADLSVDLSGSGASVRSLMSGLNGELRLSSGPARLAFLALPPGDVLTGLFNTMNPFRKKDEYTDLTCAVVRLPVRDGLIKIDRTVAYETEKVATSVAGTIALNSEALDLAMRPAVKSGFGMAGAPSKAEFARITGTLTAPKIELNTLTSARTALSVGGAIATGGLSLLGEALFKTTSADYNPCRTALGKKIPDKRAAQPGP